MTEVINDEPPFQDDRSLLQDRYLNLTRTLLPAEARREGWRVREDHCFMRIILDHLFSDCWYHHLDRRMPAYTQLNTEQLQRAVILADNILREGEPILMEMNRRSLSWRNKL